LVLLALDALSCLGFQLGLNEAQFEALCDSVHYFCAYCGPKYKVQMKNTEAQYMAQKGKLNYTTIYRQINGPS